MAYLRLIRFQDSEGKELFGEPQGNSADDILLQLKENRLQAIPFSGSSAFELGKKKSSGVQVAKLLPILYPADVPIIKCIGLNYVKHIQEGGRTPPPYPSVFIKPSGSVAGAYEDVPIPSIAQEDQCDYEGELSIIIGRPGKDIKKEDVLSHIAGYVVSNDVSARAWQRDPAYAGGVPQWCFSKGFDRYAPLGPMIVSPSAVGNASGLRLRTWVNDELRQDSDTGDLLFNVEEIVSLISQGTTLETGTVVMSGTPAGVAMGMKPRPRYLKDGDVVKVTIDQLGSVKNKMAFQ